MPESVPSSSPQKKFGTFLGVYTPSILTILGLIMYLRFGWVVGNLGVGLTVVVVLMASSITFITGLSASAIATNIQVGVGGEYYLVSRSLGLEAGGAIGIPLYLCRTLSVTFYCFGLAEAILVLWPAEWGELPFYATQLFAGLFIVLVTALSGKSADLALKAQIPTMILVGGSILALILGVFGSELRMPEWTPTYRSAPEGFWYIFAVFFPAVTGFTAGIGMSGDLKDPRKSIPKGTLGAVVSGVIIYLLIPILFSITTILTVEELADPAAGITAWTKIAFLGSWLIYPAVWGAILSSAFGSILGGPRVLQALSEDGLAPKFLSRLSKTGQPTVATWISGAIALLAVSLGELNTVAQFVSVLFLTLYVAINLSAAMEQLVAEPSYRPQIKVPWYISMLGAAGAIGVMFLISPLACVFAMLVELLIFVWLNSRTLEEKWGAVIPGFWLNLSRYAILQLAKRKIHPRNWRPLMLLFVVDIDKRIQLVKLAGDLGQNQGIITVAKILLGKEKENFSPMRKRRMEINMNKKLEKYGLQAFCEVHTAEELYTSMLDISKSHGLADLRTNTVVFGWAEERKGQVRQLKIIRELAENGKNILLVRFQDSLPEICDTIDIWWGGKENNGDLMLLLAYLLKLNRQWEKAKITIRSLAENETEKARLERGLLRLLPKIRIQAEVDVILQNGDFSTVLEAKSKEADIVFLGLQTSEEGKESQAANAIEKLSKNLKATVLVQNNSLPESIPVLLKL